MKQSELDKLLADDYKRRRDIRHKKSKDYATADDTLSNFKRRAEIFKILRIDKIITTPAGVAIVDCLLKLDRIINLEIKGRTAVNESEDDSWDDFRTYIDLAFGCYDESKEELT